jgi:YVTN family beta-propeller protein
LSFWSLAAARADTLIVGNKGEDTVSFIDLSSGQERARIPTGHAPHEVAVSPDGVRRQHQWHRFEVVI